MLIDTVTVKALLKSSKVTYGEMYNVVDSIEYKDQELYRLWKDHTHPITLDSFHEVPAFRPIFEAGGIYIIVPEAQLSLVE